MSTRFTSVLRAAALIGAAVSLSACVVAPYGGGHGGRHYAGGYGGGYRSGGYYAPMTYRAPQPHWGGGGWGHHQRGYNGWAR